MDPGRRELKRAVAALDASLPFEQRPRTLAEPFLPVSPDAYGSDRPKKVVCPLNDVAGRRTALEWVRLRRSHEQRPSHLKERFRRRSAAGRSSPPATTRRESPRNSRTRPPRPLSIRCNGACPWPTRSTGSSPTAGHLLCGGLHQPAERRLARGPQGEPWRLFPRSPGLPSPLPKTAARMMTVRWAVRGAATASASAVGRCGSPASSPSARKTTRSRCACRFVGEGHVGMGHQGAGDRHALPPATGEFAWQMAGPVGEADPVDHGSRRRA